MSSSQAMVPIEPSPKDSVTEDQDYISNLPDEIINLILSNLSIVEAVATCLLSKHWKYKWASILDVKISDRGRPVPTGKSRLNAFLKGLALHMPNVRTASLELDHEYDSGGLEIFISDLLQRNSVEKLHIDTSVGLFLPHDIFHSTALKELVLINGPLFFSIPSEDCFLNLTSLCLHNVVIPNLDMMGDKNGLVFNFPVLENLEVSCCKWHSVKHFGILISTPALKTFKSKSIWNDYIKYYTFIIRDVRLADLIIEGCEPENFQLDGSRVVSAQLQCVIDCNDVGALHSSGLRICNLLNSIASNLEELSVSTYVAQAILESKDVVHLPVFNKLRKLVVTNGIITDPAIVFEILHATRFLDSLTIDSMYWDYYDNDAKSVPWCIESVPWCINNSLEEMSIYNIMGDLGTFELAEFFLKTAAKLKAFNIHCFGGNRILEVAKEIILGYPTASTNITFTWRAA